MNENNYSSVSEDKIIFCSNCGAEMKLSSRYCMKCGTLNYEHPSNESMKKYAKKVKNKDHISLKKINKNNSIDKKGRTRSERIYKRKKIMITLIVLIISGTLIYFLWPYIEKFGSAFIDFLKESLEYFL